MHTKNNYQTLIMKTCMQLHANYMLFQYEMRHVSFAIEKATIAANAYPPLLLNLNRVLRMIQTQRHQNPLMHIQYNTPLTFCKFTFAVI